MNYIPTKVNIVAGQKEKLKKALEEEEKKKKAGVLIKLDISQNNNNNNNTHSPSSPCVLLLTSSQSAKLHRAKLIGKKRVLSIHISKKQLQANATHKGGFLSLLAGLATKALPTVVKGVAASLATNAIKKIVLPSDDSKKKKKKENDGNGLYLQKSGHCVKIEPVRGNGLYLTPYHQLPTTHGNGLYLKHGSSIYEGSGLIFGDNSPFKNIPILGLLL